MVLYFLGEAAMNKLFVQGFSKSQESFGGHRRFRPVSLFHGRLAWIFRKELRQFTRDSSEWSQFFMIGALIFVYLYNFKALPLDRSPLPTPFIANLIAFGNIGLCGFLAASLATRFVYPAVGGEKGAFYLLAASPLSLERYLFYKYLFYVIPFTALTVLLVTVSNTMLQISGPMWWISLYAALLFTWTTLALGLGFGASFADFKAENRAAAMGPGAILFLFSAVFYELTILAIGMRPTYRVVRGALRTGSIAAPDLALLLLWAAGALLVSVLLAAIALRSGLRKLRP
jgi:ABC-2 type transport system permease protein